MSAENVALVRRMLAAWSEGRFEDAISCYDPAVVWDNSIRPEGSIMHGVEEMTEGLRIWLGTWDDYSVTFDEYIDAGDHVVVAGTERGRGKTSGIEVDRPTVVVYTVRGGKIALAKNYRDREEALEAIGLSE
jgi:ketosteroid isomerase-like protein